MFMRHGAAHPVVQPPGGCTHVPQVPQLHKQGQRGQVGITDFTAAWAVSAKVVRPTLAQHSVGLLEAVSNQMGPRQHAQVVGQKTGACVVKVKKHRRWGTVLTGEHIGC